MLSAPDWVLRMNHVWENVTRLNARKETREFHRFQVALGLQLVTQVALLHDCIQHCLRCYLLSKPVSCTEYFIMVFFWYYMTINVAMPFLSGK